MPKLNLEAGKPIVMSIGGSMVVGQEGPNVTFLKELDALIREGVANGKKFALVIGGGKTAREYQAGGRDLGLSDEVLDWIGIDATRLNAQFLIRLWSDIAEPTLVLDPTNVPETEAPVMIGGGELPGNSSDYAMVRLAKTWGVTSVINASNVSHVYSDDPRSNPDAEKFEELSWAAYREIVGNEWTPGKSTPFDPIAAKFCEENGISVAIVNGETVDQLTHILNGEDYDGSLIS